MTAGLVMAAAPAQAWYVDISITGAGRVYETTDADEIDEHCLDSIEGFASPGTTPTGTLGASCRAGDASGDYGHGWVVRYVAEPAPGYTFAGWQSDGRTNPAPVICDNSGGSTNYSGTACQFATSQNLQVRARFVDHTAPAMSSLVGPTGPVNGPATFTFSAAADPTFSNFECRVAGVHEWQGCSSGRQENPSASGTYTFEVRAVDRSGNRSSTSTWQWTVDKFAPETFLDSGSGPSGVVASSSATFSFSGSGDTVGFRCTLDGVLAACSSPKSYSGLAQGTHTFSVQAVDAAGNIDSSPATRTWTVDTVAPETVLDDGPTHLSTVSSKSATFAFSSPTPDAATFYCRLDGETIDTDCSSPVTYDGLAEGAHTFRVWAADHVGNIDSSPVLRTWTVDTVAPQTSITGGPAAGSSTQSRSATFEFASTEGQAFECRLDDGSWSSCDSPHAIEGLSEGAHTFAVRASDPVGNTDPTPASLTWIVDAVPVDTAITDGPAAGSTSSSQSAVFSFGSVEGVMFECQLDGGAWTACESPRSLSGLNEGQHTFAVRAIDAAGSVDGTPATRTWAVDLVEAPVTPPTTTTPPPVTGPGTGLATMDVRVKLRHRVTDGRTKIRTLKLTRLPLGATVKVTCKGKGCAFKAKRLRPGDSSATLTKLFRNKSLASGSVVKIRVTASGYEPTAFRYKTRSGSKAPSGGEVGARTAPTSSHLVVSTPWAPRSASLITRRG